MVSFVCDGCQDTVKKPKLAQHYQRCRSAFTCVDCQTMFSGTSWESHSSCITEEQKTHGSLYRGPKNKNQQNGNAQQKQQPNKAQSSNAKTAPATAEEKQSKKREREVSQPDEPEAPVAKKPKLSESSSDSSSESEEDTIKLDKLYKEIKVKKLVKKILKKKGASDRISSTSVKESLVAATKAQVESALETLIITALNDS